MSSDLATSPSSGVSLLLVDLADPDDECQNSFVNRSAGLNTRKLVNCGRPSTLSDVRQQIKAIESQHAVAQYLSKDGKKTESVVALSINSNR